MVTLAALAFISVSASAFAFFESGVERRPVVDAGPAASFVVRQPVEFREAGLLLMRLEDGSFVALARDAPPRPGQPRGCPLRWQPDRTVSGYDGGRGATPLPVSPETYFEQTGVWSEGCFGTVWDARGTLIYGPTTRQLDRFRVAIARDGSVRVDTRTLRCSGQPCRR